MSTVPLFDRERSIAPPGYSRWLVPPAALAIHLCIGQVYSFSVFKIPLTQLLGVNEPLPGDWKQTEVAWIFSLAIVLLGLSAAVLAGGWKRPVQGKRCSLRPCASPWVFMSHTLAWSHINCGSFTWDTASLVE
jgi:hypothetical protein